MKRIALIFLCVLPLFSWCQKQNPYQLSWKSESAYISYSVVGAGTFLYLNSKVKSLTPVQIAALNPQNVNVFDRNTTKNYSDKIAHTSDILSGSSCLLSIGITGLVALYATQDNASFWNHASTLAALCVEANLLNAVTTNLVKSSVSRSRPYTYNADVPMDKKATIDARRSFFSSHTSITATNCFFAAQVMSDYYPKTWMSYSTWGVASALPAVVGFMRIEAGRHFPTDVITGYTVGALCGILVPYLHKKNSNSAVTVGMNSPQMVSFVVKF
jgi:membrane-associated phospholipid phosphatase